MLNGWKSLVQSLVGTTCSKELVKWTSKEYRRRIRINYAKYVGKDVVRGGQETITRYYQVWRPKFSHPKLTDSISPQISNALQNPLLIDEEVNQIKSDIRIYPALSTTNTVISSDLLKP